MRLTSIAIALTTLAATMGMARADEARDQKRLTWLTERAGKHIRVAEATNGRAASLRNLSRAVVLLDRARSIDPASAQSDLVRALNAMTRIHLERRSLPRAERLNSRALAVDIRDATALNLARAIAIEKGTDLPDQFRGATAIQRLAERRATDGPSLRTRGILRRR